MASPLSIALTVEQLWHQVPGGSGSYIRELVQELCADPDLNVVGVAARHGDTRPGLPPQLLHSKLPRAVLNQTWSRWRQPLLESALDVGSSAHVVHATTWAVPATRQPLVVTVHDLAFVREPGHFTPRGVDFFNRNLKIVRDEAAAVIVPSEATRVDAIAAGIEPERLTVIPHGVRRETIDESDQHQWLQQHDLHRPYVLWTGTLEPRKNVKKLLEGYLAAVDAGLQADLVLVGPDGWGDAAAQIAPLLHTGRGKIHRLGRLPYDELQLAYASAAAFVYPSLWEGFGMPPLEAMAYGVPVVTSAGTSMAEFVADGGALVDPTDAADIAQGLVAVLAAREQMSQAAVRIAAEMTWQQSAQRHRDVYRTVAGHS